LLLFDFLDAWLFELFSSSSSLEMLDEILPSSPEEELCKIESTSRSSGDDNDGLGTLCCGQALGDTLTMPHDENRLVCGCLPPPLPFLVFLHRLTRGDCSGDVEDEISDILLFNRVFLSG
jgi:hypothetical protein